MTENTDIIHISVKNRMASCIDPAEYLVGHNGKYKAEFNMDSPWESYPVKTALFTTQGKTYYSVFNGNTCKIPEIPGGEMCKIGLASGNLLENDEDPEEYTSTPAQIMVFPSIKDISGKPADPSKDVYDQIMALLNKYIEQGGGDYELTEEEKNEIVNDVLQKLEGYTKGLEYELSYDGKYYICKGIGTATEKDVVVASKINGLPVEVVGSRAFVNSGITSIVIPESVDWISDGSLACDTLKTVKIYGNLTQSSEQMGGAPGNNYGGATFIGAFENYEVNSNGNAIVESITTNTSVTNIYVWWEDGYIDRAPWGAVAAKIHYQSLENSKTLENRVTSLESSVMQNSDRIDQVKSIAEGANQAISFYDYGEMASTINMASKYQFKIGQNLMIVKLDVPDLWVSGIDSTNLTYTHTSDAEFVNSLKMYGTVQVGYYILSALETQKVDLTEYAKTSYVDRVVGDINTALEAIIARQASVIGGID